MQDVLDWSETGFDHFDSDVAELAINVVDLEHFVVFAIVDGFLAAHFDLFPFHFRFAYFSD